ncbi:MAG: tetratricopeptide repeat protein [Aestuariivita sp.]|nr:tetratricopeptide repeat protein [Aestuariivita sp.]
MLRRFKFLLPSLIASAFLVTSSAAANQPLGAYLAGRLALHDNEFGFAVQYFSKAHETDADNLEIIQNLILALTAKGNFERATYFAEQIEPVENINNFSELVVLADLARKEHFNAILAKTDKELTTGTLSNDLCRAWAYLGKGSVRKALDAFDTIISNESLSIIGRYHKALALSLMGDFKQAEVILTENEQVALRMGSKGIITHVEILSQLNRNTDALELIEETLSYPSNQELLKITSDLKAGKTLPFTQVISAKDGIAEVFMTIAMAYQEANQEDTKINELIYRRLAFHIRPDHFDIVISIARILDSLKQFDLAISAYKLIPSSHHQFVIAEQDRANVLNRAGKPNAAIEVLEQLAIDYANLPSVFSATGDLYRQIKNYENAVKSYSRALNITANNDQSKWYLYFVLGISYERLNQWKSAEANFRAALEIRPNEPRVLNYLGYSLVEKQTNLKEALDMIERAVAARPNNGYMVDSLGWVLYRLNRFEESVKYMERAVELEPIDPVINDHLGDVYWANGRYREAEFQWKRALSYVDSDNLPQDIDLKRIQRKLAVGLDIVLKEEGAPPLEIAHDDH